MHPGIFSVTVNDDQKDATTKWFKYDRDCLHLFTHKFSPGHI